MDEALRSWVRTEGCRHRELLGLGYFGSYARGDWGVGSDLDLIAIVRECDEAFHTRARKWEIEALPVPANMLVYTKAEWDGIVTSDDLFAQTVRREVIWVFP